MCDDQNSSNGDGCSSIWTIEVGFICTGGSSSSQDTWQEIWGDAKRFNSLVSYCDDGNTISGDGCSSTCSVELGYICTGGTTTTQDTWSSSWGDGLVVSLTEDCDDGNMVNGDGWDDQWVVEAGFSWVNTPLNNPESVCSEVCGDGKRYLLGTWDDGNTDNGDGWSNTCSVEAGWVWSGGSSISPDFWHEIWGDGAKYTINLQEWDDGNSILGDGWDSNCLVENGWEWTNSVGSVSVCTVKPEQKTSEEVVATQAFVGAGAIASVVSGVTNLSSPTGLWQMMNLMQLFMLILLFDIYLPVKVIDVLNSNNYFSLSFEVPLIEKIPYVAPSLVYLDFSPPKSNYNVLGIDSGSALLSVLSFTSLLIVIFLLHIWVIPCRDFGANQKLNKKGKWMRVVSRRIWVIFTFAIYIRLIFQSYQLLLIASISGIYYMNTSDLPHLVSLVASIVIAAFWIIVLAAGAFIWKKNLNVHFEEIFSGLKKTSFARCYQLLLMLRRFILIFWMIWLDSMPSFLHLMFPGLYQLLHFCVIVFVRPFSHSKDNIIEVFNELIFTSVLWSVVYLNKKEKWSNITTNAFVYLLMVPGVFMLAVTISKLPWIYII
jgi:cysteine-rich repeat protein